MSANALRRNRTENQLGPFSPSPTMSSLNCACHLAVSGVKTSPVFHKDLLRGTSQAVVFEVALEKSAGDGEVLVGA